MSTATAAAPGKDRFHGCSDQEIRAFCQKQESRLSRLKELTSQVRDLLRLGRREIRRREYAARAPRRRGCPAGTTHWAFLYPVCLRCGSGNVVRAGFTSQTRRQVFRCKDCGRRFIAGSNRPAKATRLQLLCWRCGASDCKNMGPSRHLGRVGFCANCNKRFVQGGSGDLRRNLHLLLDRIEKTGLPADVQDELRQTAVVAVLRGDAYCHNVPFPKVRAWRDARQDMRHGRGSASRYMQLLQGQRVSRVA